MKYLLTTSVLFIASASSVHAQSPDKMADRNAGTGYVGASVVVNSEHPGSATEEVRALPYLSFENIKGFDLFGTALTYRAIETGTGQGLDKWSLRAGPRLAFQGGRESEDSNNLNGFEDIDSSFPLGGYVRSTIGPVGLRFDIGKDIGGGHGGVTADASIGTFYRVGTFAIQPAATISWADNKHNDSFFSVTNAQSASSGLAQYDAGSGIYSYSLGAVSWVEIQEKYAVALIASYRWYTDDAADSPILNASDGSKNGLFAALSLSRKFNTNKW